ncbi:hypothetical protein Tco_1456661 [Tanacetum coccineum]
MKLFENLMETYTSLRQKGSCLRGSKDYSRQSDHQIEIEGQEARKEEKGKNSTTYKEKTTLVKMRSEKAKEKEKGVVLIDEEEPPRLNRSTTTLQPLPTIDPKDKGKGVLVEEEPEKPVKVKRRIRQEKYTIEERARLLAEFFERRKKQLAAERAEAIRNKPPTRTQQAEATKKRPRADSEEESSKKQKLEEDNDAEKEELRDSMDVVPRDDVAIDVESLATKYPIVDWKTHILNENMMYYQIIRADGSSKNYKIFSEMLDDFDRQDVIDLHRIGKNIDLKFTGCHIDGEKEVGEEEVTITRFSGHHSPDGRKRGLGSLSSFLYLTWISEARNFKWGFWMGFYSEVQQMRNQCLWVTELDRSPARVVAVLDLTKFRVLASHWIPHNYVLDSTPVDFDFGVVDVRAVLAAAIATSSGHRMDEILLTQCSLFIYERCNIGYI